MTRMISTHFSLAPIKAAKKLLISMVKALTMLMTTQYLKNRRIAKAALKLVNPKYQVLSTFSLKNQREFSLKIEAVASRSH